MASGSRSMEENAFKRKRGELELLTDISNIPLNATSKRACTAKTGEKIENILKVKAIKGRHASAPPPEYPPPECPPSRPSRMKSKCTTYNEQNDIMP